jgi:hypothetical protein
MNNIVTAADFDVPPYSIPNLTSYGATFEEFVKEQQEDMLRYILGNVFFDAFSAGLDTLPVPPRWQKLLDGEDFVGRNGKTYKWFGFKKGFRPFIYQAWLAATYSTHTENGVIISKNENSDVMSPGQRISQAYNKLSKYIVGNCLELGAWSPLDADNLYSYLFCKREDFDADVQSKGWQNFMAYLFDNFQDPGTKNQHGI